MPPAPSRLILRIHLIHHAPGRPRPGSLVSGVTIAVVAFEAMGLYVTFNSKPSMARGLCRTFANADSSGDIPMVFRKYLNMIAAWSSDCAPDRISEFSTAAGPTRWARTRKDMSAVFPFFRASDK